MANKKILIDELKKNNIDIIDIDLDDYNKLVLYIGKLYNEFDQKVKVIS